MRAQRRAQTSPTHTAIQLGFDDVLTVAEQRNRDLQLERETGHLPATMESAIPFFRALLQRHHTAMLAADVEKVFALREEAGKLATRLNGGHMGILADEDAPGCALERLTAAPSGDTPLWGQTGDFVVQAAGVRVRIELDGVFGIGSSTGFWHGFSAHAVDTDKPFISETGYRSFLGIRTDPAPGITTDVFVRRVLETHVARELKGKLVEIDRKYR